MNVKKMKQIIAAAFEREKKAEAEKAVRYSIFILICFLWWHVFRG